MRNLLVQRGLQFITFGFKLLDTVGGFVDNAA